MMLVAGASGTIGGRLITHLLDDGHRRVAGRRREEFADRLPGIATARIDVLDEATLPAALDGITVADHLAHSVDRHHGGGYREPHLGPYRGMLHPYASARGTPRPIVGVPFLTPRPSALRCGLNTSVPTELARQPIDWLTTELVVRDDTAPALPRHPSDVVPRGARPGARRGRSDPTRRPEGAR